MAHDSPPSASQLANGGTQKEEGPDNIEYRGHKAMRHGQATCRWRHLVGKMGESTYGTSFSSSMGPHG